MSNLTTDLKSWGSTGQLWPDNYSYAEGEAPVDAWDNKLNSEVINNIKDGLIPTVNGRLESDAATTRPTSPETGHLFFDTDNTLFEVYDGASWNSVAWEVDLNNHLSDTANPHSVTTSQIGAFPDTGGTLSGNLTVTGTTTLRQDGSETALDFTDNSGGAATQYTANVTDLPFSIVGEDTSGTSTVTNDLITFKPQAVQVDVPTGTLHEKGNRVATRTWTNNELSGKSDTGHIHDTRYYTESEVDNKMSSHTHDTRYYTQTQVDDKFGNFSFTSDDLFGAGGGEVIQASADTNGNPNYLVINQHADYPYVDVGSKLQIDTANSHLELREADTTANKEWKVEVNAGDLRFAEVGVGEHLRIDKSGHFNILGEASVHGDYLEVPVYTADQTGFPEGAIYVVK